MEDKKKVAGGEKEGRKLRKRQSRGANEAGASFETFEKAGLLARRMGNGTPLANVPLVMAHGKSIEWGYEGSGPANLALSAMEALFPHGGDVWKSRVLALREDRPSAVGAEARFNEWLERASRSESLSEPVELGWNRVKVSRLAWALHHEFESAFVARFDYEGGKVSLRVMRAWLMDRMDRPVD